MRTWCQICARSHNFLFKKLSHKKMLVCVFDWARGGRYAWNLVMFVYIDRPHTHTDSILREADRARAKGKNKKISEEKKENTERSRQQARGETVGDIECECHIESV